MIKLIQDYREFWTFSLKFSVYIFCPPDLTFTKHKLYETASSEKKILLYKRLTLNPTLALLIFRTTVRNSPFTRMRIMESISYFRALNTLQDWHLIWPGISIHDVVANQQETVTTERLNKAINNIYPFQTKEIEC